MKNGIPLCVVCLALSACSSAMTAQESRFKQEGGEVVCHEAVPVGSHLKQRVCTTVAGSKEESQRARALLEQAQHRRAAEALLQRHGRRPEAP